MTTKELLTQLPRIAHNIAIDLRPATPPFPNDPYTIWNTPKATEMVEEHLAPIKNHLIEMESLLAHDLFVTAGPGAEHIARERLRQVQAEGYSSTHDDNHDNGELVRAAIAYLTCDGPNYDGDKWWPWYDDSFKPDPTDPLHNLIRAGALIAAEIDRLIRAQNSEKE